MSLDSLRGYCECGCGEKTRLSRGGKGPANRFVLGHIGRSSLNLARDKNGLTIKDRRNRSKAIWEMANQLLPCGDMDMDGFFEIVVWRFPEVTRRAVSKICFGAFREEKWFNPDWCSKHNRIGVPQNVSDESIAGDTLCDEDDWILLQANRFVEEKYSDAKRAEWIAPVWEAMYRAYGCGVRDEDDLRRAAEAGCRKQSRAIGNLRMRSIDSMRESFGYEPEDVCDD